MPIGFVLKTKREDGTWEEVTLFPRPGETMLETFIAHGFISAPTATRPMAWTTPAPTAAPTPHNPNPGTDAGTDSTDADAKPPDANPNPGTDACKSDSFLMSLD